MVLTRSRWPAFRAGPRGHGAQRRGAAPVRNGGDPMRRHGRAGGPTPGRAEGQTHPSGQPIGRQRNPSRRQGQTGSAVRQAQGRLGSQAARLWGGQAAEQEGSGAREQLDPAFSMFSLCSSSRCCSLSDGRPGRHPDSAPPDQLAAARPVASPGRGALLPGDWPHGAPGRSARRQVLRACRISTGCWLRLNEIANFPRPPSQR